MCSPKLVKFVVDAFPQPGFGEAQCLETPILTLCRRSLCTCPFVTAGHREFSRQSLGSEAYRFLMPPR